MHNAIYSLNVCVHVEMERGGGACQLTLADTLLCGYLRAIFHSMESEVNLRDGLLLRDRLHQFPFHACCLFGGLNGGAARLLSGLGGVRYDMPVNLNRDTGFVRGRSSSMGFSAILELEHMRSRA